MKKPRIRVHISVHIALVLVLVQFMKLERVQKYLLWYSTHSREIMDRSYIYMIAFLPPKADRTQHIELTNKPAHEFESHWEWREITRGMFYNTYNNVPCILYFLNSYSK